MENPDTDAVPKRIQLRRTKGWKKPVGAIVVSRPSKWGNPWRIGEIGIPDNSEAVRRFSRAVEALTSAASLNEPTVYPETHIAKIIADIGELRGRDLACWCPLDQPCHADELLRLANG